MGSEMCIRDRAVAEGLVNGRSAAELAPKAGATRAELATILFRFAALQNA